MSKDTHSLIRRQHYLSQAQIDKLDRLAMFDGVSAAEILRRAIDSYSPRNISADMEAPELLNVAFVRLREAMDATKAVARIVTNLRDESSSEGSVE